MRIETSRDELRLRAVPVGNVLGAAALTVLGVLAATRLVPVGFSPAVVPFIRGAMFCLGAVGVLMLFGAETIDHRFQRSRGAADLSWRSVVRGRRQSLRLSSGSRMARLRRTQKIGLVFTLE